ncbi:hypothetical protein SAMN05421854_106186 [Amycolatopsis rubida]|uniref:Uncharacterized protein n=1 Tax=Amycolatopsis rubida TaxID=112413 RepID=A0A1I5S4Y1_9PSEU|nr:hypothetical protein SAMN05421854_106186 [Amycolatopsis rubida]
MRGLAALRFGGDRVSVVGAGVRWAGVAEEGGGVSGLAALRFGRDRVSVVGAGVHRAGAAEEGGGVRRLATLRLGGGGFPLWASVFAGLAPRKKAAA